jgi:hypothetical protein
VEVGVKAAVVLEELKGRLSAGRRRDGRHLRLDYWHGHPGS